MYRRWRGRIMAIVGMNDISGEIAISVAGDGVNAGGGVTS